MDILKLSFTMKKHFIYIFVLLILTGCFYYKKQVCKKGLPDKNYEFLDAIKRKSDFNYLEYITDTREFGPLSDCRWLRKSENLKIFYASIKSVGIEKFISEDEFNKPLFTSHYAKSCWENKSLNQIAKNLIDSYSDSSNFDKYYVEFWNRRQTEGNKEITLQILSDIRKTYNEAETKSDWEANQKIAKLLDFEAQLKHSDSITYKDITKNYFDYLVSIELYASADNLLRYMEEYFFMDGEDKLDFNDLISTIEKDSVRCGEYWDWRYDAKWFTDIYDDMP